MGRSPAALLLLPLLLLLLHAAAAPAPGQIRYRFYDHVPGTPGSKLFVDEYGGRARVMEIMPEATGLVWETLGINSLEDTNAFNQVSIILDTAASEENQLTERDAGATLKDAIYLNADHFQRYKDEERLDLEISSTLYHETTHVWQTQWNLTKDQQAEPATIGIIEGVAEYVTLKSPYPSPSCNAWTLPANTANLFWYSGYCPTALFLQYVVRQCNDDASIVPELNRLVTTRGYQESDFKDVVGVQPETLWENFLESYVGSGTETPMVAGAGGWLADGTKVAPLKCRLQSS